MTDPHDGHDTSFRLRNHYVICNWNSRVTEIVDQLHDEVLSAERNVIVIVTDRPIDEHLLPRGDRERASFQDVLFAPGDPTRKEVLERVNCREARGVLVLADDALGDQADARNLLTLFTLRGLEPREDSEGDIRPHIVAEIRDVANYRKFKQFEVDDDRDVEIIRAESLRTRILAQGARTPGMIDLFRKLLTFSKNSNEIHSLDIPDSWDVGRGLTFGSLADAILDLRYGRKGERFVGMPIGLWCAKERKPVVNPAEDRPVEPGDRVLVICVSPVDLARFPAPSGSVERTTASPRARVE